MHDVETRFIASVRPSNRIIIVDKDWVETRLIASVRYAMPKCIADMQCRKCNAEMHGKYLFAILHPIKLDNNWQIMMKYGKISK